MSWLTDIAGKAEDLLNQLDQNAAEALRNEDLDENISNTVLESDDPFVNSYNALDDDRLKDDVDTLSTRHQEVESSSIHDRDEDTEEADHMRSTDDLLTTSPSNEEEKDTLLELEAKNRKRITELERSLREAHSERDQRALESEKMLFELQEEIHGKETKVMEMNEQLKWTKNELEHMRSTNEEYKARAKRVLAEKDRIIQRLRVKASTTTKPNDDHDDEDEAMSLESAELQQSKREMDMLRNELEQTSVQLSDARHETLMLETQVEEHLVASAKMEAEHKRKMEEMEKKLRESQRSCQISIEETTALRDELQLQRETFVRLKTKEDERLKSSSPSSSSPLLMSPTSTSVDEMERKLLMLKKTLAMKQSLLERSEADKTALTIQLQRLERGLRSESLRIEMSGGEERDGSKLSELRLFNSREVHQYSLRMTSVMAMRILAKIDRVACKVAMVLRKYPAIRIAIIVYMGLVHVWMLVFMASGMPEPTEH